MHEQGTPEWHAARLGKITASAINNVMMTPTTAGYANYRSQLVCERLTGRPTETFISPAMQHGTETEPQARAMYELTNGCEVGETGFVDHPSLPMTGASPDGLIGADGMVEIKCPQPTEHIRMLTGGAIKGQYVLQMQWQMACADRAWCDFVSFSPALPDDLQIDIRRVERDDGRIAEIAKAIAAFNDEVAALLDELEKRRA